MRACFLLLVILGLVKIHCLMWTIFFFKAFEIQSQKKLPLSWIELTRLLSAFLCVKQLDWKKELERNLKKRKTYASVKTLFSRNFPRWQHEERDLEKSNREQMCLLAFERSDWGLRHVGKCSIVMWFRRDAHIKPEGVLSQFSVCNQLLTRQPRWV